MRDRQSCGSKCACFGRSDVFITRLGGIPRSTLPVQGFLLASGFILVRWLAGRAGEKCADGTDPGSKIEHVLLVGANRTSRMYVEIVRRLGQTRQRVVAILDDNRALVGRSM